MGSFSFLFVLFSCLVFPPLTSAGPVFRQFIRPNFTASNYQFIDQAGAFLESASGTFKAYITNSKLKTSNYYFSVFHVPSNTIVWTANRNSPISESDELNLTPNGFTITDKSNSVVWSTPAFRSSVSVLQLQESGNLVLLDGQNVSLWESFDFPTDTVVMGQRLLVGKPLGAAVDEGDLSVGDYQLVVTGGDAVVQWNGMTYWKMSMDTKAYKTSNMAVSFLIINGTGLFLMGGDGSTVVFQVILSDSKFRIAKLGYDGKFVVLSFDGSSINSDQVFARPDDDCQIPFICGKIGLCSTGTCSCPAGFHGDNRSNGSCVPTDTSLALASACVNGTGTARNSSFRYVKLGDKMGYFANDFMEPVKQGTSLSDCQDLCSGNCSCLAIFHENYSGSCYLIENHLGSIKSITSNRNNRFGYIKTILLASQTNPNDSSLDEGKKFPLAGLVLLPSSGFFLIVIFIGLIWWRKNRLSKASTARLSRKNSSSSTEFELVSIAGLPVRFDYEDLAAATENFRTQIGSGGFGTVYKGTLSDKTIVAVKKITSLGVQGKKEFCTEIAIIGNIHHVNLVRLKGYCAQHRQRFLVYEYMNRGSLDHTLFGNGPVLEWRERFEIALGTARGLAYLHSGCQHKIIHCDVKPENILLHDNLQVKISDFGLSKLLSPEQSNLFTTLRGTRGYLAPEWLTSSAVSDKTDVYSYGMVLLEIVRGRKNSSFQTQSVSLENDSRGGNGPSPSPSGSESRPVYFPLLALEMHEQRRYLELADTRLQGRVTSEDVEKLVRIALCCVHEEPMLRPTMANVVGMLEGGVPLGAPRVESLNFLRFYGRRFTEASTVGGSNDPLNIMGNAVYNSTTSGSHSSYSYMSSQQVSGPR